MRNGKCYLCKSKKLKLIVPLEWPIKKCLKCNLTQVNPLPTLSAVNQLYKGDYWKSLSSYGQQFSTHSNYFRKVIRDIKKTRSSGRLLDVGCALGSLLQVAKQQGFRAEGIDISNFAVKQCKNLGLSATQGVISDVKKKNYFDIITAFEVIEHELDPISTVKMIHKLLKKNGLLVVTVPNSKTVFSKVMGSRWFGYHNKEHLFHYTDATLRLILEKGNFKDIKITRDIGRHYLFTHYLERFNFYLIRSNNLKKLIDLLKKIPVINSLVIPFNPWGNIIAYAYKKE